MTEPNRPNRKTVSLGRAGSAILTGADDLSQWDDEELIRGQRRNKNGRWTGTKPKVVPKAVHDELVRRKLSAAFTLLRDNIVGATSVLIELATDPQVEPSVRLKAAGMILDRTLGKAPERVELTTADEPLWARAIREATVVGVMPMRHEVFDVDEVAGDADG